VSLVALRRRSVRACVAAFAATAVFSGSAIADDEASVAGCAPVPTIQPFSPWQDLGDYFLAPDGGLENGGAGWDLNAGASVVAGNEPYQAAGAGDQLSLSLASDGSPTTAPVCIGVEHRTMRFFARTTGASVLHVDAVYANHTSRERSVRLATIAGGSSWAPTPIVPMLVNEIAPDYANALPVSLRFTVRGSGNWQIDDVFVDPYRRG
jgi:hypothetical protein